MNYPYFSTIDKKTHLEIATRGGLKKRSPAVQRAWDKTEEIKGLYKAGGQTHRSLAKIYKVSFATIARILQSS